MHDKTHPIISAPIALLLYEANYKKTVTSRHSYGVVSAQYLNSPPMALQVQSMPSPHALAPFGSNVDDLSTNKCGLQQDPSSAARQWLEAEQFECNDQQQVGAGRSFFDFEPQLESGTHYPPHFASLADTDLTPSWSAIAAQIPSPPDSATSPSSSWPPFPLQQQRPVHNILTDIYPDTRVHAGQNTPPDDDTPQPLHPGRPTAARSNPRRYSSRPCEYEEAETRISRTKHLINQALTEVRPIRQFSKRGTPPPALRRFGGTNSSSETVSPLPSAARRRRNGRRTLSRGPGSCRRRTGPCASCLTRCATRCCSSKAKCLSTATAAASISRGGSSRVPRRGT